MQSKVLGVEYEDTLSVRDGRHVQAKLGKDEIELEKFKDYQERIINKVL